MSVRENIHSSETGDRTALVIGAGVCGPVVALALQQVGIGARLFEARPTPGDEVGSFLALLPNGVRVTEVLGIRERVLAAGFPGEALLFQNHRGRRFLEKPVEAIFLKRGALHRALREAAVDAGISVEFGRRLVATEQRERSVTARFEDGSEASGDLLIGCDGIHSATRRAIMPEAPVASYTGVVATGAFTRDQSVATSPRRVLSMTFGTQGFFGYIVADDDEVFWFENFVDGDAASPAELQQVPPDVWLRRLETMHAEDHDPIPRLIRSTGSKIGRWPIYDMPQLSSWHSGRVCLIGDAAHAASPHEGQGASLALEDAVELARTLRDADGVEEAFAQFEANRKPRVDRIVRLSRRSGTRKAPTNRLSRAARDALMPVFLRLGGRTLDRAYAHRVGEKLGREKVSALDILSDGS